MKMCIDDPPSSLPFSLSSSDTFYCFCSGGRMWYAAAAAAAAMVLCGDPGGGGAAAAEKEGLKCKCTFPATAFYFFLLHCEFLSWTSSHCVYMIALNSHRYSVHKMSFSWGKSSPLVFLLQQTGKRKEVSGSNFAVSLEFFKGWYEGDRVSVAGF